MSSPDFAGGDFGAEYWESRYRAGEETSRHDPSPSLVTGTTDLPPGRALDAGCGLGADAIWLAARGWHVTAVDVSATAIEQGRASAQTAGRDVAARIEWVHADLTRWHPADRFFDLVTSHYVHVPGPVEDLIRRLAAWVAPGGTLLVVGHDHAHSEDQTDGHNQAQGHHHRTHDPDRAPAPGSRITAGQITGGLARDEWEITVAGSRTRTMGRPGASGTARLHDAVVLARRHGPPHS